MIFFVDIFVQFNLAIEKGEQGYYGDSVELITDRREIAWEYLSKWFTIDLLAISPLFIYIASQLGGVTNNAETTNIIKLIKAARIPRLFRLLRIFRVMRTLNMKSKAMQWFMYSRYSYLFNVFSLIMTLLVLVHIYACFWYITSNNNIAQRFNLGVGTLNKDGLQEDGTYDESYTDLYSFDSSVNTTVFKSATYIQAFHQAVLIIMGESMDNETDLEKVRNTNEMRTLSRRPFHPPEHSDCPGLHQRQRLWISTQVAVKRRNHAEIANAWPAAEQVRLIGEVRIQLRQQLQVVRFNHLEGLRHRTKRHTGGPHSISSCVGLLGPLGAGRRDRLEVKAQKIQVLLREVPAVVHRRAQQSLCSDDVEEPAEYPLLR